MASPAERRNFTMPISEKVINDESAAINAIIGITVINILLDSDVIDCPIQTRAGRDFKASVAPIIVVDSVDQAIQEANDTQFGLGASIWTSDIEQGFNAARHIKSGIVCINDMVKSDPRMPFGGIKKNSGIGRELSDYGIKEFVNIKSIIVKDPSIPDILVE